MKDELIQQLRMLGMGRVNAAQAIADILMPDQPTVAEVQASTTVELIERFDGPATVEIEVEPSPTSWAGLEKARADVVAEYFAPETPPDPAPAKPKRKKA
jgi:hypothetical protein